MEIYSALSNGQREIINLALTGYKAKIQVNPDEDLPQVLRCLVVTASGTNSGSLPTGFLFPLSVYTSSGPVYIRPDGRQRSAKKVNSFLASSSTQIYCGFTQTNINFETNASWNMEYLQSPPDMTTSIDPTLTPLAYNAIVEYAIYSMLDKDKDPLSAQHLQVFLNEIQNLIF